jgi:hypothetical protein
MVLSERPLRLVHLDLGDGYTVEPSLLRGLTLAEVRRMVGFERGWRNLIDESNAIYATLKPGEIVHYHNSFGQYIRCEAVPIPPNWKSALGHEPIGQVVLKPIALVGGIRTPESRNGWFEHDIFTRFADGTVHHGHHAQMILDGELFQPNGGSIFESPNYHRREGEADPREMEPMDLNPPAMTDEQERIVPLAQAMKAIGLIVNDHQSAYTEENLRANLAAIGNIVKEVI